MKIEITKKESDFKKCFPLIKQLVTNLDEFSFLKILKEKMKYGYQLIKLELNDEIIAIAGIKEYQQFSCGKMLILDEIVVDSKYRRKGYGGALFNWIVDYAKENGVKVMELSSHIKRVEAHSFYTKKGMHISHHHFSLRL